MAEILLFPLGGALGSDQTRRLSADLTAAHAGGLALGSRVPHIRAGGERQLALSVQLERTFADLDRSLTELGLQDQAAGNTLRHLLDGIQGLNATIVNARLCDGP